MTSAEPRRERLGWRDFRISDRHRMWGVDCPGVDIDFLLVEFDRGTPKALVEYKHENSGDQDPSHPTMRALATIANAARIPFFCVRYAEDFAWFEPVAMNRHARDLDVRERLSEAEWVDLLYWVRARVMPDRLLEADA